MVSAPLRPLWVQPHVLLTLTSLFWAGNAVVGRAVIDEIPPVLLAQLRWTGAFAIVLVIGWRDLEKSWPVIRQNMGMMLVLSFLGVTAFNTLLYWGLQYTTAISATLVQVSAPLLIAIWGFVIFGDRLTLAQAAGILISGIGVALIVTDGRLSDLLQFQANIGDLVILAAVALYALYTALLRSKPKIGALAFLTFTIGAGAILLLPFTIGEWMIVRPTVTVGPDLIGAVLYVIIFPSLLAYFFFNRGVELIGSNRAGAYFYLIPLFAAVLAIVFLGERPTLVVAVAAVLILAGVLLAARSRTGVKNRVV